MLQSTSKRAALVTGASAGFGAAIARILTANGWRAVIAGRRIERLRRLAESADGNLYPLPFDIRTRTAVSKALAAIPEEFLPIEVLVNNAGLALGLEPSQRASFADWDTMIDTNIRGLIYLTRTLLPDMVKSGRGHVINLGSVAANNPYPGSNVYGATKAFVRQFSRNLRADLLGTGVRVTEIAPGLAETEFSIVRFKGDRAQAANVYHGLEPLHPADIARAVMWAIEQPPHVNINLIELMPTAQAWGPLGVCRT